MGPAVSDYNKRLIILSVIQLSGGHCTLKTQWSTLNSCINGHVATSLLWRLTVLLDACCVSLSEEKKNTFCVIVLNAEAYLMSRSRTHTLSLSLSNSLTHTHTQCESFSLSLSLSLSLSFVLFYLSRSICQKMIYFFSIYDLWCRLTRGQFHQRVYAQLLCE